MPLSFHFCDTISLRSPRINSSGSLWQFFCGRKQSLGYPSMPWLIETYWNILKHIETYWNILKLLYTRLAPPGQSTYLSEGQRSDLGEGVLWLESSAQLDWLIRRMHSILGCRNVIPMVVLIPTTGGSINGGTPKSSHFLGFSPCEPSIFRVPHLWKPPHGTLDHHREVPLSTGHRPLQSRVRPGQRPRFPPAWSGPQVAHPHLLAGWVWGFLSIFLLQCLATPINSHTRPQSELPSTRG